MPRYCSTGCTTRDGDLLVCHPAQPGAGDALAGQRAAEFEVLARPELGEWMRLNGVKVARPLAA